MTLEQMEALGQRAAAIRAAKERLREAEKRMALLNRAREERKNWHVNASWRPTLILKKGDGYGMRDVTIEVEVPFAVVQQQLAYAVQAARREVIQLGGEP